MNESTRRKVNMEFDNNPTYHHVYNFKFSTPYITNKKILDIGCWTGQFASLAILKAKSVTGIDPGARAVKIATKMIPKAVFKNGNALSLPFKEKVFDTVTMLDVIEHLPKNTEVKALAQIRKVLTDKGYLILSTPSNAILSILLDPAFFIIGHRHYSLNKIEKMLNDANFKITKVRYTGGFYTMFSGIIQSVYKHILAKKFIIPDWYQKKIDDEYTKNGFTEIHIVAKVSDIKN